MRFIDVFNGDADGLCALRQLRLAEPVAAELVTGPKRSIDLLTRVAASAGDRVTVLDISLDRNRPALERLLDGGASVRWFDHHFAGDVPSHPRLEAHIDTRPETCTSALVDGVLGGRFRAWAVAGAFGDGLPAAACALADSLRLDAAQRATLQTLGEVVNYNAYGESEDELLVAPARLYQALAEYDDPLRFAGEAAVFAKLRDRYRADMTTALGVPAHRVSARGAVYLLPHEDWSRRVSGPFANHLAASDPERAHAVLVPDSRGGYKASIRAPRAAPIGAVALARRFPGGGGREAAAGIDHVPPGDLATFIEQFDAAFGGSSQR